MYLPRRIGGVATAAVALVLAAGIGLASEAAARKFSMNGTWFMRRGQVQIPLEFFNQYCTGSAYPTTVPTAGNGVLPLRSCGLNKGIPGSAVVDGTGTGSNLQLTVPASAFKGTFSALAPLNLTTLVQIKTAFYANGPAGTATVAGNPVPGPQVLQANHWSVNNTRPAANFTWCLDADGAGAGTATGPCTAGQKPPAAPGKGRVIYTAGPKAFGGTMRMMLAIGGVIAHVQNPAPFRLDGQVFGGAGATLDDEAPGGAYATIDTDVLPPGSVTQPLTAPGGVNGVLIGIFPGDTGSLVPPFNGLTSVIFGPQIQTILRPGPKVTTKGSWTGCFGLRGLGLPPNFSPVIGPLTGPNLPTCTVNATPGNLLLAPLGQTNTNFGFARTTGTVIAQQTSGNGGADFFTYTGTFNLDSRGFGNITLVAGGATQRIIGPASDWFASPERTIMTLSSPVPSMSPAGIAAGAALMILAVGYALRRRF
jgi:hypothetical protein